METDTDKIVQDQGTQIALIHRELKTITDSLALIHKELGDVRNIDKTITTQAATIEGLTHRLSAVERDSSDFRHIYTNMQTDIISRIQGVKDSTREDRKEDTKEILEKIEELSEKTDKAFKDSNARLSALENWRWYLLGAIAVLVFIAAGIPWQIIFTTP